MRLPLDHFDDPAARAKLARRAGDRPRPARRRRWPHRRILRRECRCLCLFPSASAWSSRTKPKPFCVRWKTPRTRLPRFSADLREAFATGVPVFSPSLIPRAVGPRLLEAGRAWELAFASLRSCRQHEVVRGVADFFAADELFYHATHENGIVFRQLQSLGDDSAAWPADSRGR